MAGCILALDQGTTSSRALLFDAERRLAATAQREFAQSYPRAGWVEHDPEDLFATTLACAREALERGGAAASDLAGIGITNQRETTLVWEKATGRPVHPAIVWQDRRTAEVCRRLRDDGAEAEATRRTGLLLDPYFSASKISWILDHVEGARTRAEAGELLFGTVETWLIWRLTEGRVHATDASNASRTLLCNLEAGQWDPEMARLMRVPMAMLPEIRDCAGDFGRAAEGMLGAPVPILGAAGDQQAATLGQACFRPGMLKCTYGTGAFALLVTGDAPVASEARLLSTIAWQIGGRRTYALEGSIFVAGAAVQWLRDGLGSIRTASETEGLAGGADPSQRVYMVPAFAGLGAPWWDAEARGAIFGLTRGAGRAELARAALESVAFQTADLMDAMRTDAREAMAGETVLRVDGGLVVNDWAMQFLADILDAPVDRPALPETTALGAAWLAGMQAGVWPDMDGFAADWALDRRFEPSMPGPERAERLAGWHDAVRRTRSTG